MDINGIISNLSPETISAVKQADIQLEATAAVAGKALDAQKAAGEAAMELVKAATGKGVTLDLLG